MAWLPRILATLAVTAGAVAVGSVAAPGPALASCAAPARTAAHPFIGTVTGVVNQGRTATVRTDDGRTVTVQGSAADTPGAATSVDRTFEQGMRYEFHPINDGSPYRDNACTATHPFAGADDAAAGGPAGAPAGDANWLFYLLQAAIGLTAVAVLTGAGLWLVRRRRHVTVAAAAESPDFGSAHA